MSAIGELLTASKQWKASHPKHKETKPKHKRSMGMLPLYELQPIPNLRHANQKAHFWAPTKVQEAVCVEV
jgi:hypothetical protein